MTHQKEIVLNELDEITDPCSEALGYNLGLISMGLVDRSCLTIDENKIRIKVRLTSASCEMIHYFSTEINKKMDELGFDEIDIRYDYGLEWCPNMMTDEAKNKMEGTVYI